MPLPSLRNRYIASTSCATSAAMSGCPSPLKSCTAVLSVPERGRRIRSA